LIRVEIPPSPFRCVVEEAGLSIIAALDDVLRNAGKIESRLAWHRRVPDMAFRQGWSGRLGESVGDRLVTVQAVSESSL